MEINLELTSQITNQFAPKWTQSVIKSVIVLLILGNRRNLPAAQRLAVVEKFKKKIQEEAKENQGERNDLTSSPNGEKVNKSVHTDKELAKLAGVGSGTVARYNRVPGPVHRKRQI